MPKTLEEKVKEQALRCREMVLEADRISTETKQSPQEVLEQLIRIRFSEGELQRREVVLLQNAYLSVHERLSTMIKWLQENKGSEREISRIQNLDNDISKKIGEQAEALV